MSEEPEETALAQEEVGVAGEPAAEQDEEAGDTLEVPAHEEAGDGDTGDAGGESNEGDVTVVENKDEMPVVVLLDERDQTATPSTEIAQAYRTLYLPAYTEDDGNEGARVPCDRGYCKVDESGWLTTVGVLPYPLFETSMHDLGAIGGVGMRQYYFILKALTLLFLFLGTVSVPAMVMYGKGEMYNHPAAARFSEVLGAQWSKGNIVASEDELSSGTVGELWLGSITNAVVALATIFFTLWMGKKMNGIVEEVDSTTITMRDYTVRLMPTAGCWRSTAWADYQVTDERTKDEMEAKLKHEIEETVKSEFGPVAAIGDKPTIWIGWDEREHIDYWVQKTQLLTQLEAALQARLDGGESEQAKVDEVMAQITEVNRHLIDLNSNEGEYEKHDWLPVTAFVAFEDSRHREQAVTAKTIEVAGVTCNIGEAPEPETLKWSHLEYGWWSRALRRLIILVTTLFMLGVGVWLISGSHVLKEQLSYTDMCSTVLGRDAFDQNAAICPGALTDEAYQNHYRSSYTKLQALFSAAGFPRVTAEMSAKGLPYVAVCNRSTETTMLENQIPVVAVSWPDWVLETNGASCHRLDTPAPGAPHVLYAGGDVDSMCYACACSMTSLNLTETAYCETFMKDKSSSTRWGLFATVIVVIVNQVLKQIIVHTSPWLKSHTVEEELQSKVVRIFLCQLTNTAILVLLSKSTVGPFAKLPGEHYSSMNAKWYAAVAAPMLVTMMIQFSMPVFMHICMACIYWVIRLVKSGSTVTQNQLNALYIPKPRDFAAGYGEILLAMSVTLIYGPAIPALYFVAAAGFGLRYCVEMYADLRLYRKPPLYSKQLVGSFDRVLMVMMLLHTGFSGGLVTVAGGVLPTDEMPFRPATPHAIPMLVAFIMSGFLFVYKALSLIPALWPILHDLPGGKMCILDEDNRKVELDKFSKVYEDEKLANEDDDYYLDEREHLERLQNVFIGTLNGKIGNGDGLDHMYERARAAVESTVGKQHNSWYGQVSLAGYSSSIGFKCNDSHRAACVVELGSQETPPATIPVPTETPAAAFFRMSQEADIEEGDPPTRPQP